VDDGGGNDFDRANIFAAMAKHGQSMEGEFCTVIIVVSFEILLGRLANTCDLSD